MNNLIGQHLGPYRILEQIGVGGMATVYKAYQPAMERYVAVKVIAPHFAQDETFLRRFRREARAVAQLEHAHILPVHDYGEAEGRPYLVMRYLEAGTLKDRMAQRPLPLTEVNRIIGQVGSGLDYAHRMGVIHRDVKPSNVLLDAEGDAFLTDFGLAKMLEASVQLTETGVGIGTPAYMSPEQGRGERVDSRTDVYSLGVILYEMVTGRPPYEAETPLAVVFKHIQEPLPLPRSVRPDLSEEMERVILKALAKDPDDRFQTAGEMVRALDGAVRAAEAAARTEPAVAEVAVEPDERAAARLRRALPAGWARAAMWAGLGLVILLALFLILSRVPIRVQISGGQLEVVRIVERTATPTEAAAATTPTSRPTATPTATAEPAAVSTPGPTISAQEHTDRAEEYVARAHWDEAIAEIARAIEQDPTNPRYYITRAFLYDAGKGMMEEAIADATKAIELAPTLYDAWIERCVVYMHMEKCALAVADCNEAIRLDPDRLEGYAERGGALSCQGRLDAAIADFDRAIGIDPTSAWAFWNRGMIYEQKGDLDAAIADYSQAIVLEPDDPWASPDWYYSRAGAYRALGRHEQALADCDAALALVPDDPRGFYCRGLSEVAMRRIGEARADFEQAVSLTPVSAWSAWVTDAAQAELDKMAP
ncbi:MAG TPA: tetratricopeptide repeat protein [Chloroflexi bacterium]|nr:tetratricopeptide repeat protein [Chloroflexota bacterium]